jgi:hypothetical protein
MPKLNIRRLAQAPLQFTLALMRIILCLGLVFSLSLTASAQSAAVDPCMLIDKADVIKVLGDIKEGPKPKEGLMKEKQCEWTNMSGSWLSVGVYSSEQWGLKKGDAFNLVEIKDLGDEAFSNKRGTDAELYVRKGKLMIEVRTSAGAEAARKTADIAVKKIP